MFAGVPVAPLMLSIVAFLVIMLWTKLFWLGLFYLPLYLVMRGMIARDDQAFRIFGLKVMHGIQTIGSRRLWRVPCYSDDHHYKKRRRGVIHKLLFPD